MSGKYTPTPSPKYAIPFSQAYCFSLFRFLHFRSENLIKRDHNLF